MKEDIKYPMLWWVFLTLWTLGGGLLYFFEEQHGVYQWIQHHLMSIPYQLIIVLTHMGTIYFVLFLYLLFFALYPQLRNKFYFYFFVISQLVPFALVQLAKQIYKAPRPAALYEGMEWFNKIPEIWGHTQHYALSFPSGHTEGIAAVISFIVLSSPVKHKSAWTVVGALLIAIVAFSRMYLSQHFFLDVWVGGMISIWTMAIVYMFYVLRKKHL